MYSERLLDHFMHPRSVGRLEDANGVGIVGDPSCGDFLCIYIKVENMTIVDISFLCKGCPASIASASATVEIAKGRLLEEAILLKPEDIVVYLGGMPEDKLHCSNLGIAALHYAVANYLGLIAYEDSNGNRIGNPGQILDNRLEGQDNE
ncbi:MAG: iron-sulfur cluster assembly scaffold protein [Armatimonadota bacterium]